MVFISPRPPCGYFFLTYSSLQCDDVVCIMASGGRSTATGPTVKRPNRSEGSVSRERSFFAAVRGRSLYGLALAGGFVVVAALALFMVNGFGRDAPEDLPLQMTAAQGRLGATPTQVEALLNWARSDLSMLHENVTLVNMDVGKGDASSSTPQRPWGWGAVAFDSRRRAVPSLLESAADVAAEANRHQQRVKKAGGEGADAADAATHHRRAVAIRKGDVIAKIRFSKLPFVVGQDARLVKHDVVRKLTNVANQHPYVEFLRHTHLASSFLLLSQTEADRCLGPRFHDIYRRVFADAAAAAVNDGDRNHRHRHPPMRRAALALLSRAFNFAGDIVLLPFVDMLNHRNHDFNVQVAANQRDSAGVGSARFAQVTATRDIAEGEELNLQYGTSLAYDVVEQVQKYGFFDEASGDVPITMPLFAENDMLAGGKFDREQLKAAKCRGQKDSFWFHTKTGRFSSASLKCAELAFWDPPVGKNGVILELGDQLPRFKKFLAFKGLLQTARINARFYPVRNQSLSEVPSGWVRDPGVSPSFIPSKSWRECVDPSDDPQSISSSFYDMRRDIFETVFVADDFMRSSISRAEEWLSGQMKILAAAKT